MATKTEEKPIVVEVIEEQTEVAVDKVVEEVGAIVLREEAPANIRLAEEEELEKYVKSGDWELVEQSPAFLRRSPEGQTQTIVSAIRTREKQILGNYNHLLNGTLEQRSAAIGMWQRAMDLRSMANEVLNMTYGGYRRALASKSMEGKVEFDK